MATLLRDDYHAELADEAAQTSVLKTFAELVPPSYERLQFLEDQKHRGIITRKRTMAIINASERNGPRTFINLDAVFRTAKTCPLQDLDLDPSFIRRSRYACGNLPTPLQAPATFYGDVVPAHDLELTSKETYALFAATGSIKLPTLAIDRDTVVIALGDIAIDHIVSSLTTEQFVTAYAPLGKLRVISAPENISIIAVANEEQLPINIRRAPWRSIAEIPLLPSVVLGFFPQRFRIAP